MSRDLFCCLPEFDALIKAEGLDFLDDEFRAVYANAGEPDAWKRFRQDVAHVETPEMSGEILPFLKTHLH